EPGSRARAPGSVEEVHAPRGGLVVEAEDVTADTATVRLDHGEHGIRGDGGIRSGAARLQHLDAGERGERMGGGHHAVATERYWTKRIAELGHESISEELRDLVSWEDGQRPLALGLHQHDALTALHHLTDVVAVDPLARERVDH